MGLFRSLVLVFVLSWCVPSPSHAQVSTSTFPCRTSTNTAASNERAGCVDPLIKWGYTNPSGAENSKYFDTKQEAAQARLAEHLAENPSSGYEAIQTGPIDYQTYYWCSKPDDHTDTTYTTYNLTSGLYFSVYFYGWRDNAACSGTKDVYVSSSGFTISAKPICPYGYQLKRSEANHTQAPYGYVCIPQKVSDRPAPNCAFNTRNSEGSCTSPNPVNLVSRHKEENVVDLKTTGPWPIVWSRSYNSAALLLWHFNQEKRLLISQSPTTGLGHAFFKSESGTDFEFKTVSPWSPTSASVWVNGNASSYENNAVSSMLSETMENGVVTFVLGHRDGSKEVYQNGYLVRRENHEGYKHFYEYDDHTKRLKKIRDEFGHFIEIHNTPNNGAEPWSVNVTSIFYENGVRARSVSNQSMNRYTNANQSLTYGMYMPLSVTNGHQTVTYEWGDTVTSSEPNLTYLNKVTTSDGDVTEYKYKETINGVSSGTYMLTGVLDGVTGERLRTYFYNGSTSRTVQKEWKGGDVNGVGAKETYTINVSSVSDQNGNTFTFTSDAGLKKIKTVSANCYFCLSGTGLSKKSYTYDTFGNVISSTDFSGEVEKRTYDAQHRVLTQTLAFGTPDQRMLTYVYSGNRILPDSLTEQVWVNGVLEDRVTSFSYNARNQITQESVSWNGQTRLTDFVYNDLGLLESVLTDHTQTAFTYDHRGWISSVVRGAGTSLERSTVYSNFTPSGLPQTITHSDGRIENKTYSSMGRLLSISSQGQTESYTYTSRGLVESMTFVDGSSHWFTYDASDALLEMSIKSPALAELSKVSYTRDGMNNVISIQVTRNGQTDWSKSYTWSKFKSVASEIDAFNQQTLYGYHTTSGLLTSVQEPLGRSQSFVYDTLGRVKSHTQPNGGVNQWAYAHEDQIAAATDSQNASTTYTYDGFGDVVSLQSPDRGTWSFAYDKGRLVESVDPRGVVRTMTYDALGRIKSVIYNVSQVSSNQLGFLENGSETHVYVYDVCHQDRLCSISDAQGQLSFSYDPMGRWSGSTRSDPSMPSLVFTQAYDATGRISQQTYPSGKVLSYTYGDDGKVASVTYDHRQVFSSTWNALGQPLSVNFGFGVSQQFKYNANGDVAEIEYPSEPVIYQRDALARVEWMDGQEDQWYTYNAQNEILSAEMSQWGSVKNYSYDLVGNRLSMTEGLSSSLFAYTPNSNRLSLISHEVDGVVLSSSPVSYDAMGNVVSFQGDNITYDAKGRLARWQVGGVETKMYYNALGQRTKKIVLGGPNEGVFLEHYDSQGRLIGTYTVDATGALKVLEELVYLDGFRVVSSVRPDAVVGMQDPQIYPIITDHLGSPRAIYAPSSATKVWSWSHYEAFGHQAPNETLTQDRFVYDGRFPGQRFDESTNSMHNGFRTYSSKLGRYMQSDPLGLEAGWNTYAYVGNNPVGLTDYLGLACNQKGCWNTDVEKRHAKSGNLDMYYRTACKGGDTYACRAHEVASGSATSYLNYSGALFTNARLEQSLKSNGCSVESKMEDIRLGLMRERVEMLDDNDATWQNPYRMTSKQVSDFHREVFDKNGADPVFGGDFLGRNRFGHFVVNKIFPYCTLPACEVGGF